MRALLDTSTLIAAMLPDHVHHCDALPWLARAKGGAFEFVCSGHSLAEIYAVLTRLKRTPPIRPDEAWRLIQENVTTHARVQSLSGDEYAVLVEDLARIGIVGAAVYDAVIARVGELAGADFLVTLNVADFQRVWPAGAARVVSPQSHPPPRARVYGPRAYTPGSPAGAIRHQRLGIPSCARQFASC